METSASFIQYVQWVCAGMIVKNSIKSSKWHRIQPHTARNAREIAVHVDPDWLIVVIWGQFIFLYGEYMDKHFRNAHYITQNVEQTQF